MYTDNGLRLATAEDVSTINGGTAPLGIGAASATLDLDPYNDAVDPGAALLSPVTPARRNHGDIGGGRRPGLAINVDASFSASTWITTLEIQLVSIPVSASLLTNAATAGKLVQTTGVALTDASDDATITGHNLPLGTPFYITALATTGGVSNNTLYYAVPTAANTFKFATSLENALAGTTVTLSGGNGTCTVNWIPTIHATTGQIQLFTVGSPTQQNRLQAGQRLMVPLMTTPGPSPKLEVPTGQTIAQPRGAGPALGLLTAHPQRYFHLRYLATGGNIAAGAVTVDLVADIDDAMKYYASGYEVI